MQIRLRKHRYALLPVPSRAPIVALLVVTLAGALWVATSGSVPPPPSRVVYVRAYTISGIDATTTPNANVAFDPATIIVAQGTVVTLRVINLFAGPAPCAFELDEYDLHSGPIPDGGSWEVTFTASRAGVFVFYCDYHMPFMVGVLDVVAA